MRRPRADGLFDGIATFGALCASASRAALGKRRGPGPAAFLANLETEVLGLEASCGRGRGGRALGQMTGSIAPTSPAEIERPTPTAHRLVEVSVSPNTRRAYSGALRRLDAWLAGPPLDIVRTTAA